jgi:hypothetical protein
MNGPSEEIFTGTPTGECRHFITRVNPETQAR